MSDQSMSAESVRTMLAENLDRVRKATAEYFQLMEKGLASSPLPIAGQAKQYCDMMQRNAMSNFDLCDKLIKARDVQDSMKIQSEFLQEQMRAMTDQAKNMGESAMKAMTGAFTPKV